MTGQSEGEQPLHIENALVKASYRREHGDPQLSERRSYPERLGRLAREGAAQDTIRLDEFYDRDRLAKAVVEDFEGSYALADAEAGQAIRDRSLAWFDWLVQEEAISVHHQTYMTIARVAASRGDVSTAAAIVNDPARLWAGATRSASHKPVGREGLSDVTTRDLAQTAQGLVDLVFAAPSENVHEFRGALVGTLLSITNELADR